MSLNPQEISSILSKHFDELAPGEFLANLKEACPYLFEENEIQDPVSEQRYSSPDNALSIVGVKDRTSQKSSNSGK